MLPFSERSIWQSGHHTSDWIVVQKSLDGTILYRRIQERNRFKIQIYFRTPATTCGAQFTIALAGQIRYVCMDPSGQFYHYIHNKVELKSQTTQKLT